MPPRLAFASVVLLMLVYLLAYLDRIVISLLVDDIKAHLAIGDTEIGLIQGVSFGLVYTLAALPFGWLADRRARRKVIGYAVLGWSALTAACGFVSSAAGLLVTRTGVALGEAALGPSAAPLIRELFPPHKAVRALSIYMLGIPLGSGLALIIGATLLPWVKDLGDVAFAGIAFAPWQTMMVLVALPGFGLGLLVFLIPEPPRTPPQRAARADLTAPLAWLKVHWITFVGMGLPGIAAMIMTFGAGFWLPPALTRTYGLGAEQSAFYLQLWGLASIALGLVGTLFGGVLIDRLRALRGDAYILVAMATVTLLCLCYGLFLFAPDPATALIVLAPAGLAIALPPLVATAAALELIPRTMRSSVLALWMTSISLIGMSSGPPLIGFLADRVIGDPDEIRYAFAACGAGGILLVIPALLAVRRNYLVTQGAARTEDETMEMERP